MTPYRGSVDWCELSRIGNRDWASEHVVCRQYMYTEVGTVYWAIMRDES